ncbi:1-acyl-sn-glycerol-3-phosphate acyltransferase [Sorangium sp. So ce296]|uniref:lysophospholipid acyltransferase family protein n=1 Tax=Sorangium sp. So ce296 TaxID=3133296 RepID=UPI003F622D95
MDEVSEDASHTQNAGASPSDPRSSASAERPRARDLTTWNKLVFPSLRALIKLGYFSFSVEGAERVPQRGPVVYVANHAGWFTIDTLFIGLTFTDHVHVDYDRLPWVAVQDQLYHFPTLGDFWAKAGGFPSSWLKNPRAIPREYQAFWIYPEGTEGNCKSFLHAYQMRKWRTGFLRLAIARGAQIVPVAIVGSEECMPSVAPLRFLKPILGTIYPLPLTMVPLPSRWKFIFHDPVDIRELGLGREGAESESAKQRLEEVAESIRGRVQRTLDEETSHRALVRLSRLVTRSLG